MFFIIAIIFTNDEFEGAYLLTNISLDFNTYL